MTAFGLQLPSFASDGRQVRLEHLVDAGNLAVERGFRSLWFIDHFLRAPTYGQAWLDPFLTIAALAPQVPRAYFGTAVLVTPLRHPVQLAKEAANLQFLSDGRLILGLGVGWNPAEFEALGIPHGQRGRRTDEVIRALRRLLAEEHVSFEGQFYSFEDVTIEPRPATPIPIWIGGGSQPAMTGSSEQLLGPGDVTRTADAVIRRIASGDGWCAPPHAGPGLLADDWRRVDDAAKETGRDLSTFTFAQQGYFHVVDTADRKRAYAEQQAAFSSYVGAARPWSFVKENYLVGTVDDIISRLAERAAVGTVYNVLAPVVAEPRSLHQQIELMSSKVMPAFDQGTCRGTGQHVLPESG